MTKRLTNREQIEADYLALAKEYSDLSTDYEQRLLALQARLDKAECPRLVFSETRPRKDALDMIAISEQPTSAPAISGFEDPSNDAAYMADIEQQQLKNAARTLRLCIDMLKSIPGNTRPSLYASACIIALGDDDITMRQVAKEEGVSPEWVSKLTKRIRIRFCLPRNQHNKSSLASEKYRAARLGKRKQRVNVNVNVNFLQCPDKESFTIGSVQR